MACIALGLRRDLEPTIGPGEAELNMRLPANNEPGPGAAYCTAGRVCAARGSFGTAENDSCSEINRRLSARWHQAVIWRRFPSGRSQSFQVLATKR